jgi:16S rRNA processing protein RimM
VIGHRGAKGELTVRLTRDEATLWTELRQVWIGMAEAETVYEIESSRAYRNRLVLKLKGIDGADQAAQLRGMNALVAPGDEPQLPEDVYYAARLVGMDVRDEQGNLIGRINDVIPTAGADLLLVNRADERGEFKEEEAMIPLAKEIVIEVSEESNRVTVRLPEGLLDINKN